MRKQIEVRNLILLTAIGLMLFVPSLGFSQEGKGATTTTTTAPPADESGPAEAEPMAPATGDGAPSDTQVRSNKVIQLKDLESRVNELKERIFRSKARLNLLKETVLHGMIAGSRALIFHRNDMGGSFKLVKLVYAIDGAQIYSKVDDSGALDEQKEFEIFNGSIVPGNHTISVEMQFRGHGYGIFSYLKGYRFNVKSSHTFTAGEGRQTGVTVRAYEKGNFTTEHKDRPGVEFKVNIVEASKEGRKQ